MRESELSLPAGSGYARPRNWHNSRLTEVRLGTPMGELLRRYWHPVGLVSHATRTPREVRVLGEDLILFRDDAGRPGPVQARCAHRGNPRESWQMSHVKPAQKRIKICS